MKSHLTPRAGQPGGAHPERSGGFTLLELLVVIAVIVILASLIIPVTGAIDRKKKIAVARAQLHALETAIDSYHAKLGFYPPDNTNNAMLSPLYFELEGTILTNIGGTETYITRDGSGRIPASALPLTFNVASFANSSRSARNTDESRTSTTFVQNLRPDEIGQLTVGGAPVNALLSCSVGWPDNRGVLIPTSPTPGLNPWRYVASHPTNNPSSYDLWVDIFIGNKTNRISNWSPQPQVVP